MAIEAAQLDDLSVEREAVIGEGGFAEADAAGVLVDELGRIAAGGRGPCRDCGLVEVPELDVVERL